MVFDALDRAIRLDPRLAQAYFTRAGFEMQMTWDWAAAQADIEKIREIEPRNRYFLPAAVGDLLLNFGQIDQAIEQYRIARTVNALAASTLGTLGRSLTSLNLHRCLWTSIA
jgi:tetratricopeptide (TPR) repeat protein